MKARSTKCSGRRSEGQKNRPPPTETPRSRTTKNGRSGTALPTLPLPRHSGAASAVMPAARAPLPRPWRTRPHPPSQGTSEAPLRRWLLPVRASCPPRMFRFLALRSVGVSRRPAGLFPFLRRRDKRCPRLLRLWLAQAGTRRRPEKIIPQRNLLGLERRTPVTSLENAIIVFGKFIACERPVSAVFGSVVGEVEDLVSKEQLHPPQRLPNLVDVPTFSKCDTAVLCLHLSLR